MDLMKNAIESIKSGIEDYNVGTHPKLLSGVRNIHAGILLLYKEALRRLSPSISDEVLIKERIMPIRNSEGEIIFVGNGKKTIGIPQIKEYFSSLDIATDWKRFDQITALRNDIEHYYTKASKKSLESIISNAFIVVRNFIIGELKEDPLILLGDTTWQVMLAISEVYDAERAECQTALKSVDWQSDTLMKGIFDIRCPACSGDLLSPAQGVIKFSDEMTLQCRNCGEAIKASNFVPDAIASALSFAKYLVDDDGEEEPYIRCPVCGIEAYVMDENKCALCGETVEHRCMLCRNEIPANELDLSSYCGYCEYMLNKDD